MSSRSRPGRSTGEALGGWNSNSVLVCPAGGVGTWNEGAGAAGRMGSLAGGAKREGKVPVAATGGALDNGAVSDGLISGSTRAAG